MSVHPSSATTNASAPTPPVSDWNGGWWTPAHTLASPNFGPRPPDAQIDLVVLHSISLPPGQFGTGAVQQLFTNTLDWSAHPYFESIRGLEVSAHFFITRSGEVWQFVDCNARAWHAGVSQWRGRNQCNDDSIGIELEGLEGNTFETAQYDALTELCQAISQRYAIHYIAGHEHIAPGRKRDPGDGFDWQTLRTQLSGGRTARWAFPPGVQGAGSHHSTQR
jgi:AmpD protein